MKTINNIIENSALGLLNKTSKYTVVFLFSAIVVTALALFIYMLENPTHVSTSFNF